MGEVQGQGYVGQALGAADLLATVYTDQLTYRPEDPEWAERDRFLLSTGHYAIGFYATIAADQKAEWRPGMAGEAKIEVGPRRLVWVWTHRFTDWVQIKWWQLW